MPSRVDKHPIAICGVALRLPGDLNSAEKLWNALRDGKDMRGLIPASRYSRAGFDSSLGSKGAIKTQYGYFLNQDVSAFDSSQFSLTEDEIKRTDPQQRLLLEVVEECFENAGETTYRGRDIACYVGAFAEDWLQVQSREDQHSGGYVMSGQIDLMLANRVSYEYDLRGPSMVIKTGCSASLIALHEACRALQMEDCDGALVAGSNLILGPNLTAAMTTEGILSPEGSCKTFDIKADGFARGEAITAVYLQRLDQAIENRLPIRAIITNTGTNSDGRSQGLLQPSSEAQISLMRKVHGAIDSKPNRTAFVECHGTGTPTGDPIETAAVGQVFGSNSNKSGVYIGSIKPNIGHSEGASGISSLLKAILMLEKGMIVPNIKFDSPNPKIEFERFGLKVPREVMPWPRDRDMRVAINSFGIGGSNAHIIVEHPYTHLSSLSTSSWRNGISFRAPQLLLLSASTSNSVQQMSTEYKNYIEEHESDCLPDVAYTLALRREHRQYRTFAVFHEDNEDLKTAPIRKSPSAPPGIIMVFTGQGAQWAQMGHELLNDSPEFLRAIQHMDQILLNLKIPPKWSIQSEIRKPLKTSQVNRAEISQPLCTAIQVALVCMLVAAGIKPQAVAGHSSGEIAAAYAAGLMTMEVAIVIAYYRGLVTNYQTLNGGMAAIGLSSGTTQSFLKPGVVIACENSPNSTTISGDGDTVDAILEDIKRHHEGVLARRLKVDMAYHSHHMYGLSNRYVEMLRIELKSGEKSSQYMVQQAPVPMFSSVNNQVIMSREILSPEYWCANLTSPVRFSSAISNLLRDQKNNLFLELGPHSALSGPLREICASAGVSNKYCPTLIRSSHSTGSMLTAFGTLYQHGIPVKWDGVILDGEVVTDLPVYPWNHSASHWYESRASQGWRLRKFGHHELLGLRVPQTTDNDPVWRVMLNIEDVPWLVDHQVNGGIVFPFAGYACMAGEAFRQIGRSGEPEYRIRNVKIITAMVLDETRPLEIVTSLHGQSDLKNEFGTADHVYEFAIASYTGSTWIQHCTGQIGAPRAQNTIHGTTTESLPRKVAVKTWYGELSRLGLRYGPSFRRVQTLTTSTKGMLAVASISTFSDDFEENGYGKVLHATSIDASLQVGIAALSKGLCRNLTKPRVPVAIEELEVLTGTPSIHCTASYSRVDELISIDGVRDDGRSCLHLRGLKLKELDDQADLDEDNMYGAARLEWVADYDFQDISSLVKVPPSANRDKEIIEELALLCVVESVELVQDLTPSEPYLVTYRQWLERVANEAFNNQHPVLKNTRDLVSLSNEDRNSKISQLCIEACSSPLTSAFAEGTMRIREHIRQLFTGEADALELLLQENNLARIYDSISFDYADFICTLSDTVPNLRILEIGAGTGGTAELILRGMQQSPGQFPRYSQYTFSDISAGFFPKARERFAGVPNMDFKVLDISQDPIQQGLEPESYDLIIAANVVHATPSLSQTLRNLYPLLKKTGQLVLTEFCTYFRAPNYIYGNFVGWWLGEEDDRKWEPYVDTDRWDRELQAVGFSGATDVIFDAQKPFQYCATIVTRKPAEAIQLTNKVSILCENPETPLNRGLLEDLTRRGLDAKICALSLESNLKEGDIIATLDLEEGFFENITEENFTLFQNLCRTLNGRNLLWLMPSAQINCVNPRSSQCLGLLRSARSELDISITTLELDLSVPDIATLILGIFSKVRAQKDSGTLAPDREFAVHENVLKVGRYRPFNLYEQGHSKALLDGNPRTNGNFSNANEHSENLHNGAPKPSVNGFNHDNDTTSLQLGLHTTYTNGHNGHSQNGDPKPAINWSHTLNNTSSLKFDSDAAYLITGGLGGLGRAISVWMAECGAREIVFLSPSAGTKPTDQDFFTELLSMGCIPVAIRGLVQNEEDVAQAAASAKFPIKGVLHLAMHLRDEAVLDMTHDQFKTVTAPKVHGTWNLHNEFGDSLDFFVMASSLSTVINQPGQGNYNAANTFMESFCQYRHSLGLAASVLNICPIEGVGYVAENSDARRKLKSQGHCFLDERALLEFLELVIVNSRPAVSLNIDGNSIDHGCRPWVNNSHIVMGLRSEVRLDDPSNRTTWRRDRRMGAYHNYVDQDSSSASLQGTSGSELKEFISRAANEPDSLKEQASKQYLGQEIGKKLFSFIMRPEDEIDTSLSLVQVGLDSLMAIELRRWWKQTFGVDISVLEIMNSGTISGMGEVAAEGLRKMLVEFE
jgi:acyl transferase domain-containing protein/SAM-dependent methyltransferase/NAD(P)-dependent dehydrogenase (short-subunit alcohol dehydrogenase family)/aryl carrier-like protein